MSKWERREIIVSIDINGLSPMDAKTSWSKSDEQEDIYIVLLYLPLFYQFGKLIKQLLIN